MVTDDRRDFLRACAHCGNRLTGDALYPVTTELNNDGEPVLHSFCDDGCRSAWGAER